MSSPTNEKKVVDSALSAVPGAWRFDEEISKGFDSHVRKSIPFYEEIQRMVVELSEYFIRDQSVIYDLGSSTGSTIEQLSNAHKAKENTQFTGFDISEPMVQEARKRITDSNVRFIHKNILDVDFSPPAHFVTSLFTLQFLTISDRRELLARVNEGMVEGGGLCIVEKTRAQDSFFEDIWLDLHWDYKRRQGLTPEQILEKANSIRGVLNPLSTEENIELLNQTGFSRVEVFFRWYNWTGLLAVKNNCHPVDSQSARHQVGT
ncbi:MAG: methyltransferase domain-containing protein [Pseudomonadota bacterium]